MESSHNCDCFRTLDDYCVSSEIYTDPGSCGEYYQCIAGQPIKFDCGQGFIYDVSTQSCVSTSPDHECYEKSDAESGMETESGRILPESQKLHTNLDINNTIVMCHCFVSCKIFRFNFNSI